MNPGNKEIARSTANQPPGMLAHLDVAGKVGSWGTAGDGTLSESTCSIDFTASPSG